MIEVRLNQLIQVLRGELVGADAAVNGVSIDTRSLQPGQLFFAIKGENSDGHAYLEQAKAAGASAAVVEHRVENIELPQLIVGNCRLALGQLAAWWRAQLSCKVVALTGSNGKTTVKEMLAAILALEGKTLATRGNLNNDLGMPLTLLSVGREHEFAVLEMGANNPGEIEYLTHIVRPDVALVNNAGPAHLEGFGDLRGVARAKGEIYSGLSANGVAIINADDEFADYWRSICADKRSMNFGLERPVEIQGRWQAATSTLSIQTPAAVGEAVLQLLGRHNASNALAAATTALAAGASFEHVLQGLASVQVVGGRLQRRQARAGFTVIDDSYNANPASLLAGAGVAAEMAGDSGAAWLAMGDLGELGPDSEEIHKSLGNELRQQGIQRLFTLGTQSAQTAEVFGEGGLACDSVQALADAVEASAGPEVVLLVKGSRTSRMERVVHALCEEQ